MLDERSFAHLVEEVSRREYPPLPTAVGFCMYIMRGVIEKVGTFDESFSPGYEEENDFCMRAYAAGYVIVLDDSTFVYHEGRVSFKGEGRRIAEEHLKLIQAKHPH